jgi:hypothetical protein
VDVRERTAEEELMVIVVADDVSRDASMIKAQHVLETAQLEPDYHVPVRYLNLLDMSFSASPGFHVCQTGRKPKIQLLVGAGGCKIHC